MFALGVLMFIGNLRYFGPTGGARRRQSVGCADASNGRCRRRRRRTTSRCCRCRVAAIRCGKAAWRTRRRGADALEARTRASCCIEGREALGISPLDGNAGCDPEDARGFAIRRFWLGLFATLFFAGLLLRSPSFAVVAAWRARSRSSRGCGRRALLQREPQTARRREREADVTAGLDATLPVGSAGERSGGWWGVLTLIVTEGSLFGYLIFTYLYLAGANAVSWPPEGLPKLGLGVLNTAFLLSSSGFVWFCERACGAKGRKRSVDRRDAVPRSCSASCSCGIQVQRVAQSSVRD